MRGRFRAMGKGVIIYAASVAVGREARKMEEAIPWANDMHFSEIIAIHVHIAPPRYIRSRYTKPFACFLNTFLSGYNTTFAPKCILDFSQNPISAKWVLHLPVGLG